MIPEIPGLNGNGQLTGQWPMGAEQKAGVRQQPALTEAQRRRRARELVKRDIYEGDSGPLATWPSESDTLAPPSSWLYSNLWRLRARARWLMRNDWFGRNFTRLMRLGIVGPGKSLGLMSMATDENDQPLDELQREIERKWKRWANSPALCDARGEWNFKKLMALAVTQWAVDGELFIWVKPGRPLKLEVIDPARIPIWGYDDGAKTTMGIRTDDEGRPVGYHIVPLAQTTQIAFGAYLNSVYITHSTLVPKRAVIHWWMPWAQDEFRGEPLLTPALELASTSRGHDAAALKNAQQAATRGGMITPGIDAYRGDEQREGGEGVLQDVLNSVDYGVQFSQLPPGTEITPWPTMHPHNAYPSFARVIAQRFSAAVGVSYHTVSNDLAGVNFSAGKLGETLHQDWMMTIKDDFDEAVTRKIFRMWLARSIAAGEVGAGLPLAAMDFECLAEHKFISRGWGAVDPVKHATAINLQLQNGTMSRTEAIAASGRDPRKVRAMLEAEKDWPTGMGAAPAMPPPQDDNGTDGSETETETESDEDDDDAEPDEN